MYLLHCQRLSAPVLSVLNFWLELQYWRNTVVIMRPTGDRSMCFVWELTGSVWRVFLRIGFGVNVRLCCCNYDIFRYPRTADVFAQCDGNGQLSARSCERLVEGWQAQGRWHAETNVTRWQPTSEEDEGPTTSFCAARRPAAAQVLSRGAEAVVRNAMLEWSFFSRKQDRQQAWLFVNRLKVILVKQSGV